MEVALQPDTVGTVPSVAREVALIDGRRIAALLVTACLLWAAWQLRTVVAQVFVAIIVAAALRRPVDVLVKRGVPRVLAAILVILGCLLFLGGLIALSLPPLVEQFRWFAAHQAPLVVERVSDLARRLANDPSLPFDPSALVQNVAGTVQSGASRAMSAVAGFVGSLFAVVTSGVLAWFMIVEEDPIGDRVPFVPRTWITRLRATGGRVIDTLGAWLLGQLTLCLAIGALTFVGALVIGLPAPLALAVLAALLEAVPYLGPVATAGLLGAVALASPHLPLIKVGITLIFCGLLQQAENQFLVPLVMRRAMGFSPMIVVFTLILGANLAGPLGALLALPLVAVVDAVTDSIAHPEATGCASTRSGDDRQPSTGGVIPCKE